MNKYYLRISFRKIVANLPITSINLLGLSIGFVTFLLIMEYVAFENNFDRPNPNIDNLYRITTDNYREHKLVKRTAKTCSGIGKLMKDNFPEVLYQSRLLYSDGFSISYNDKDFTKLKLISADSSFLTMFNIHVIEGDIYTALREPNSLVLTERLAKSIFGEGNNYSTIVGKEIQLGNIVEKITGICKNPKENSSFQFDLISSYTTLYSYQGGSDSELNYGFTDLDFFGFVQLMPSSDHNTIEEKLESLVSKRFNELTVNGNENVFHLQPFNRVHYSDLLEDEIFKTTSYTTVWGLYGIGLLLLAIAWVNFINITVARSLERTKEMSLRKILGATSNQSVKVFLMESSLVNLIALSISLIVLLLVQNSFNNLIQHDLGLGVLFNLASIKLVIVFLVIFFIGVLTTALYPAYLIAKVNPILGLKGRLYETFSVGFSRKLLVGIQMTITMALVSASIIVYKQVRYAVNGNSGYDISQVLVVNIPKCSPSEQNAFMDRLRRLSGVEAAAASLLVPGSELFSKGGARIDNSLSDEGFMLQSNTISPGFIETYKMKLSAGRDFTFLDGGNVSDSFSNVIINEKSVKILGLQSPTGAIGRSIFIGEKKCNIIGVVGDFHQKPIYHPIQPIIFLPGIGTLWKFSIKFRSGNIPSVLALIKLEFKTFFPGKVFNYFFVDESFNAAYQSDILFSNMLLVFLFVSITLASISIFCISLFYTIKRRKEMCIRKILGASMLRIVWNFLRDFFFLSSLAFIVSSSLTTIFAYSWLNSFSYRISVNPLIFIIPALSMYMIIIIITSFHTIKLSLGSPVKGISAES